MKRVAITGISGYIGTRLLARLDRHPDVEAIIGVDVRLPAYQSPRLRFYRQDVTAPLDGLFAKERVDAVVHLAFVVRPVRNETRAKQANVLGTHNVIQECRQSGVRQLLYLGSTAAYGAHRDNLPALTEESPLRPNHKFQYSRDKAETDQMFQSFARGVPETDVTVLRSCVVIGPGGIASVGAKLFQRVMARLSHRDPEMQFVHEDDLLDILVLCLEKHPRGIYNVAGDGVLRYSEVAKLARKRSVVFGRRFLAALMNIGWLLHLQSDSRSAGLDFIAYPWVADNTALKKALAFEYKHTSRDAITDYAEEVEAQRLGKKGAPKKGEYGKKQGEAP